MGPQATVMFYQMIIDKTAAACDQEHIETVILSDTAMPDRTATILSGETAPLLERMGRDLKQLEGWGCDAIAIPCNTSHYFIDQLQPLVEVPILHMVRETAKALARSGKKRPAILATDGTVQSGQYQRACGELGMEAQVPPPEIQKLVMSLIYDEIKAGELGSRDKFIHIHQAVEEMGCDCAILACTELSVYRIHHGLPPYYVDAMEVLAECAVTRCGKQIRRI